MPLTMNNRLNYKWSRAIVAALTVLLVTSCGSPTSGQTQGYKETKSIVLDILKSEDGKKAILNAQKGAAGEQMKMLSSGDSQQIQMAVKEVLSDTNNNKFLQKMMTDPKFAGDFAKALKNENKQLHKDLIKDPEYQQSLMDLMKNPEFERMLLDVMKSSQYRQQTMSVMQESMQSPLFRLELMSLLRKILEEETNPNEQEKGGQKQAKGKQGGQQGGGGQQQGRS